jgi:hypothetical protein
LKVYWATGAPDYKSFVAATTIPATTHTTIAICSQIHVGDIGPILGSALSRCAATG